MSRFYFLLLFLLSLPLMASAQGQEPLTGTLNAKGYIGGESHNQYVVAGLAGQPVEVRLRSKGKRASMTVSASDDFFSAEPLPANGNDEDGQTWTGVVPASGRLFVYVVAYPVSNYRLRVKLAKRESS